MWGFPRTRLWGWPRGKPDERIYLPGRSFPPFINVWRFYRQIWQERSQWKSWPLQYKETYIQTQPQVYYCFFLRQGFENSITQFSNPARCELEIRDGENLRQWSLLKISHNTFVGQPFRKNSSSPSIHNNETFFNLLQSGFFFIFSNVSACFMPLFSFYLPWKHQKTRGLMMFSGRIERGQWYGMLSWF